MGDAGARERRMTPVHVRELDQYAEVLFAESARIYRLSRSSAHYAGTLRVLSEAAAGARSVRVRFDAPNGDAIERAFAAPEL
jgi:hypothetical protein